MKKRVIAVLITFVILAGAVFFILPRIFSQSYCTYEAAIASDFESLAGELSLYQNRFDRYPTSDEGLQLLVDNGFLNRIRNDPWGNPYHYRFDDSLGSLPFQLVSLGPDDIPSIDDFYYQ